MKVIVNYAPISERYWAKGEKATISGDYIRLGGCWFKLDDRYLIEEVKPRETGA